MSSLASHIGASLAPSHLPSLSSAKAARGSSLGGGGASSGSASASGDTTTTITNADGSLSITTTNAQGQIVSIATLQSAGAAVKAGTLLNRLL